MLLRTFVVLTVADFAQIQVFASLLWWAPLQWSSQSPLRALAHPPSGRFMLPLQAPHFDCANCDEMCYIPFVCRAPARYRPRMANVPDTSVAHIGSGSLSLTVSMFPDNLCLHPAEVLS
ncbi:hypothetical protein B0H13DRAFT_2660320 [Mycena leptocephala]|nr:hypothetical protein B0H13DRAFT_2660320 [Mycena leptocephala]